MRNLENEIKTLIIECLHLEDLTPDDIQTEESLFEGGLGLDSIDALEIGMALQKKYQIKLDGETEEIKAHFYSVQTIASFVHNNQAGV